MAPTARIAVLECDTPLAHTRAKYGSYGGVFISLLQAGAEASKIPSQDLKISTWDVVNEEKYPELENIDAILITGSRFNAFDDTPWLLRLVEYVKNVLAQDRVRIIGVCFGHQVVGRAMGAKVARSNRGWEASVCEVDLSEKGREVFGKQKLNLHQMHKDIVYHYPGGVQELGSSPKCEVQGMYVPRRLITVQGHPEFNKDIVTELLETRHEQRIFDDETFEDGMARVGNAQDGVVVAKAFLRFAMEL
ncbi:hypothetical protein MMC12_006207 [Toensbergia leucococca]|nr:hypothetical protein [Toensbergia leucococca]